MKQPYVIIAAHNEEGHISSVLQHVRSYTRRIVVVDDGSKDKTAEIARREKATVLRHAINLGKGAAVKTGCDYAVQQGAERIILIDADGQHEAADIPRFLEALETHDIVFGYRQYSREMPWIFRLGNISINLITRLLYGLRLRDTQCGYRAFWAKVYRRIRWMATDYAMESEMIAHAGKHNLRYVELPIKTKYHDRYKGTTVMDGVWIVAQMIWWKISR